MLNAPTADVAINQFIVVNALYFISLGLFSYFIQNLTSTSNKNWIVLIGPMFIAPLSGLIPYETHFTEFGWVVKAQPIFTPQGVLIFLYLISYFVLAIINLYALLKRSKTSWLRRKYEVMLAGFLFQLLGVFVVNVIISMAINVPHVAGLFYFISLLSVWYALNIEAPKEVKVMREEREVKAMVERPDILKSYQRFLDKFLQVAPADDLGLKTIDFLEYLDRTRLSDIVTYDKLRVILNVNRMGNVDNIQALDRTIEYLESKEWGGKLAQTFLDVLESVLQNVQGDAERMETFNTVIIGRQEFLKRTDIIYGLAGGRFLEYVQPDSSLRDLLEWNAVVRFYVRLLLPLRRFITGSIKADFLRRLRSADVIKFLEVSDDGEIEAEAVVNYVNSMPEKRRVEAVREGFNMLLVWTMQRLAESDPSAYADYLRTIRRITKLNAKAKGIWRAYFSLVDRATKELGRARIRDLVLSEGYSYADLEAFSSPLGLSHDALVRNIVTLEYDPRYPYEHYVSSAMREVLANTERCILFTRLGSRVLEVAKDLGDVELKVMTTIGTIEEGIPFNDTSKLLDIVGRELESELATWIVFDNISDLVLAVGFDEAYVFARRVIDLVSSKGASLLLLMNKGAHSTEVMRTFEGLSTRIVEAAERLRLIR
jgi:hypothetical protein